MAFSFSSFLPPKMMLGLIRQRLENELNDHFKIYRPDKYPYVVTEFVTIIDFKENRIDFLVDGNKYPLDDYKKFMSVVQDAVQEKIGTAQTYSIQLVVVNYKPKEITATVAYIKDGKPTQETHTL